MSRSNYSILRVEWPPLANYKAGVAGLLDYFERREAQAALDSGVRGLVDYVAFRDHTQAPGAALFGPHGQAEARERRQLVEHVKRSHVGLSAKPSSGPDRRSAWGDLVISPEDASGLDLKSVARAVMAELERQVGLLPSWLAAEHRNTDHRHVQVVLPAYREVEPGQWRRVWIGPPALRAMKEAMLLEIAHQRGAREPQRRPLQREGARTEREAEMDPGTAHAASLRSPQDRALRPQPSPPGATATDRARQLERGPSRPVVDRRARSFEAESWRSLRQRLIEPRPRPTGVPRPLQRSALGRALAAAARRYRLEAERLAEERGWSRDERSRERERSPEVAW